ncbi:MAG: hypothetical protein HFJ46_02305 [Clostridia bacterium]|nr:hypothetical protein [Clostridia bacterium]
MSGLELTSFITAIANWIACEVDDDELDLLSDIFSQLGDTLSTISSCRNCNEKGASDENKNT